MGTPASGTAAPAAPKTPKTFGVTLTDPAGNKLRFIGLIRKSGSASTFVQTIKTVDGKRVVARGATQDHATTEAARKAQDKLVADAVAIGWVRRAGGGGIAARKADAFGLDSLPRPAKAAPAATAKK